MSMTNTRGEKNGGVKILKMEDPCKCNVDVKNIRKQMELASVRL